jgi:hypothetical protein
MEKQRALVLSFGLFFILACSIVAGNPGQAIQPTSTPQPTYTPLPTYTPFPTDEVIPPTGELTPMVVTLPTVAPSILPQEWKGLYNQAGYGRVGISLVIEEIEGNSFKGRMLWMQTQWYRLTINRMNGEYVQDFGDAFEQARWSHHPDYSDSDKSGTWLKWTETEMISGKSMFTMNGWYYAHIRTDGTLIGIYYFNATEKTPAADTYELRLNP